MWGFFFNGIKKMLKKRNNSYMFITKDLSDFKTAKKKIKNLKCGKSKRQFKKISNHPESILTEYLLKNYSIFYKRKRVEYHKKKDKPIHEFSHVSFRQTFDITKYDFDYVKNKLLHENYRKKNEVSNIEIVKEIYYVFESEDTLLTFGKCRGIFFIKVKTSLEKDESIKKFHGLFEEKLSAINSKFREIF